MCIFYILLIFFPFPSVAGKLQRSLGRAYIFENTFLSRLLYGLLLGNKLYTTFSLLGSYQPDKPFCSKYGKWKCLLLIALVGLTSITEIYKSVSFLVFPSCQVQRFSKAFQRHRCQCQGYREQAASFLETSIGLTHSCSILGTLLSFKILSCQGNEIKVDLALRANEESSLCAAWAANVSKYCGESQELLVCDSNQPKLDSSSLSWLLATSQRLPYSARVSARLQLLRCDWAACREEQLEVAAS